MPWDEWFSAASVKQSFCIPCTLYIPPLGGQMDIYATFNAFLLVGKWTSMLPSIPSPWWANGHLCYLQCLPLGGANGPSTLPSMPDNLQWFALSFGWLSEGRNVRLLMFLYNDIEYFPEDKPEMHRLPTK